MDDEFAHHTLEQSAFGTASIGANVYSLSLQMGTSQAVHVLIEVHHLKAVELVGHGLYLVLLTWLLELDTLGIPKLCVNPVVECSP